MEGVTKSDDLITGSRGLTPEGVGNCPCTASRCPGVFLTHTTEIFAFHLCKNEHDILVCVNLLKMWGFSLIFSEKHCRPYTKTAKRDESGRDLI